MEMDWPAINLDAPNHAGRIQQMIMHCLQVARHTIDHPQATAPALYVARLALEVQNVLIECTDSHNTELGAAASQAQPGPQAPTSSSATPSFRPLEQCNREVKFPSLIPQASSSQVPVPLQIRWEDTNAPFEGWTWLAITLHLQDIIKQTKHARVASVTIARTEWQPQGLDIYVTSAERETLVCNASQWLPHAFQGTSAYIPNHQLQDHAMPPIQPQVNLAREEGHGPGKRTITSSMARRERRKHNRRKKENLQRSEALAPAMQDPALKIPKQETPIVQQLQNINPRIRVRETTEECKWRHRFPGYCNLTI